MDSQWDDEESIERFYVYGNCSELGVYDSNGIKYNDDTSKECEFGDESLEITIERDTSLNRKILGANRL